MKFRFRFAAYKFALIFLVFPSLGYAQTSPKWRLFSKPEKSIQSLTLVFVEPPASENLNRQKNFTLSAMGLSPCANWIGQRVAMVMSQSGTETVYGGTHNVRDITSILSKVSSPSFRLLFTPTDVSIGRDGAFGPDSARVHYRVRLYAPDDIESALFESTSYMGNSRTSNFIDFYTWQLTKELMDAGVIANDKSVRPEVVETPAENCPRLIKQ